MFRWGGDWDGDGLEDDNTYDAMHFEIACTPTDLKTGIDADGIPGSAPQPVRVDVVTTLPRLEIGAKGDAVKQLQGLVGSKVDLGFGPATDTAVKAAQKQLGLNLTGLSARNRGRFARQTHMSRRPAVVGASRLSSA